MTSLVSAFQSLKEITDPAARACADSTVIALLQAFESIHLVESLHLTQDIYPLAIDRLESKGKRQRARAEQLKRDPKQEIKQNAKELWREWKAGNATHRSGAAFDRHIVAVFDAIQETKTVRQWRKQWEAEAKDFGHG